MVRQSCSRVLQKLGNYLAEGWSCYPPQIRINLVITANGEILNPFFIRMHLSTLRGQGELRLTTS